MNDRTLQYPFDWWRTMPQCFRILPGHGQLRNWRLLRSSVMLQPLRWRCVDCMIHHERDVRDEQKYMYVARTSNNRVIPMEWSWWVTSNNSCETGEQLIVLANGDDESDLVGWSLLLLAATVRSFAHMPLGISDHNSNNKYGVLANFSVKNVSVTLWFCLQCSYTKCL